jgi:hypothetical protein
MIAALRRLARGLALRVISAPPVAADDLESLIAAWGLLGSDERRVLTEIALRLIDGYASYGALDIATDSRDWRAEEHAEHLDAVVYSTIATLAPMVPQSIEATTARAERLAIRLERIVAMRRAEAARDTALGDTEAQIAEIDARARKRGES